VSVLVSGCATVVTQQLGLFYVWGCTCSNFGACAGCAPAGGDALERGHHVNTVVFDKTGTLTRGRPQVTEAVLFNSHYSMQQVRPAPLLGSHTSNAQLGAPCWFVC
jgi:hypothetical protein